MIQIALIVRRSVIKCHLLGYSSTTDHIYDNRKYSWCFLKNINEMSKYQRVDNDFFILKHKWWFKTQIWRRYLHLLFLHKWHTIKYVLCHGEVYLIQHSVMKFVSDLRQVGGFHLVLRFPPPIKLTATI